MTSQKTKIDRQPGLARFLPILNWLPQYDRSWLRFDILRWTHLVGSHRAGSHGLCRDRRLATASRPLYAGSGIAGLRLIRHLAPPGSPGNLSLGCFTGFIRSRSAGCFGSSSDPETYQAYATAFVLVTGLVFLAAGLARLGFITQFLSKPVMSGFVMGLAIFVAVGQLNKLFGVEKPEGNTVEKLLGIIKELPQANWMTFVVGIIALALLFLLPRWNKKIPAGLVVLFGAIGLSTVLDLSGNYGVEVVGTLPKGLPSLTIPQVPFTTYLGMVLPAIGVLLVAFSEALGVAHEFAEKHGYEVNADQELNAHALANITSSLFGGMIAAGSMSASAVKEGAGARTQVTNLVAWAVTIVTLLFLDALVRPAARGGVGSVDHPCGLAHYRLAQASKDQARIASRGLVWSPGAGGCVVNRRIGRYGHRPGGLVDIRGLQNEPTACCFIGTRPRSTWRLLRPEPASRECAGAGSIDRTPRCAVVLCQRTYRTRPGERDGCWDGDPIASRDF